MVKLWTRGVKTGCSAAPFPGNAAFANGLPSIRSSFFFRGTTSLPWRAMIVAAFGNADGHEIGFTLDLQEWLIWKAYKNVLIHIASPGTYVSLIDGKIFFSTALDINLTPASLQSQS